MDFFQVFYFFYNFWRVAASIKKPPHPNGGEMMWRSFLMKGTFWGMFFVGVGFGGNSREPSIPHNPNLVKQRILK